MKETKIQHKKFESFEEFYPFYLQEHYKAGTKALHFFATICAFSIWGGALVTLNFWLFPVGLGVGYLFAWGSHFLIEKNKPATFANPIYGFRGDMTLFYQLLTRQRNFVDGDQGFYLKKNS